MFSEQDYSSEMNFELHKIYVDTQEKKRFYRFHEYLRSLKHTQVEDMFRVTTSNGEYFYYSGFEDKNILKCRLPKGDYFYNGNLFEFKSPEDLINSVNGKDKRLNQQIDDVLKDPSVNQCVIISNILSRYNFKDNKYDREHFENIKNFFNQFVPFHIHFIPATSEEIAFRDMINIWRCSQSPINLFTLNKKYPLNPFLTNLTIIPALNHNDAVAIYKTYPFSMAADVKKLTKDMLLNVRFGRKKRFDTPKVNAIIEQRDILFPNDAKMFLTDLNNPIVRQSVWENIKSRGD